MILAHGAFKWQDICIKKANKPGRNLWKRKQLMQISKRLKGLALTAAKSSCVIDIRVGHRYAAVRLDNGQVGLAFTFHEDSMGGCGALGDRSALLGRSAFDLLSLFDSTDKVESAVALATLNGFTNKTKAGLVEGDVLEHLRISPDDTIGMIGYFAPMVPVLQKRASSLKVFEQIERPEGDVLPESEAYKQLPSCQVVLITSTSIVNHTIDGILDAAHLCREVVLLGASTPMLPEAFAGTPVTLLSGVVVTRPQEIMDIVGTGGGMRLFKNHIRKVNLRLKGTVDNHV